MSSKSAVKLVVPAGAEGTLFRWVAILTGSKNALKGVGFFAGGLLLTLVGFQTAMLLLAAIVLTALVVTWALMRGELGRPDRKARFGQMFSNNRAAPAADTEVGATDARGIGTRTLVHVRWPAGVQPGGAQPAR